MRSGEKPAERPVGVAGVDHVAANPSPENRDAPRPLDPDAGNFLDRWFAAIGGTPDVRAPKPGDPRHVREGTIDRSGIPAHLDPEVLVKRGVRASDMGLPGEKPGRGKPD